MFPTNITYYYCSQDPSMIASTSTSPTLAESEPHHIPHKPYSHSVDGVKSWLTALNPDPLVPLHKHREPDFNQHEHPTQYVPTVIRRRAIADPNSCQLDHLGLSRNHPWTARFRAGSVLKDHNIRASYASDLVMSGPWDPSIVSELAAKFCERVTQGLNEPMVDNVALFAREVYDAFISIMGHTPASFFENQLRHCILTEFRAWWLHKLPSAIVQISFHSPSPPHAPPLNLFHSALGVATFIGRLFHVGLVSASFVLLCLHILVDNLSVIEELSAIHAIISHANESLYKRVRMRDFLDILDKKVAKMSPTSSVTFQADVSHDIACHVQNIKDIIQQWANIADTPTPSEASDAATFYSEEAPEIPPPTPEQLPIPPLEQPAVSPIMEPCRTIVAPPATRKRWADVVKA
ncbi:hypothetical protein NLI96_g5006 [Meripilus lineatus]|uniref:Uncharacterized protein n=1 Tax=Meripilus lineatus TaxID=2056292 RepID=A0AAD5V953_9APHY|nr:hypothetical protein NLI96_g5006 [Physisporinus lineatus]